MQKQISVLLIFLPTLIIQAGELQRSCLFDGGQLVENLICPKSGELRDGTFCLLPDGKFYNGCTGLDSKDGFGKLFFSACKLHDHCYHQEPATHGLNKKTCDFKFYRNLKKVCSQKMPGKKRCRTAAYSLYRAVRVGGDSSWQCSDFKADYPTTPNQSLILVTN